jgi:hypothetical protein
MATATRWPYSAGDNPQSYQERAFLPLSESSGGCAVANHVARKLILIDVVQALVKDDTVPLDPGIKLPAGAPCGYTRPRVETLRGGGDKDRAKVINVSLLNLAAEFALVGLEWIRVDQHVHAASARLLLMFVRAEDHMRLAAGFRRFSTGAHCPDKPLEGRSQQPALQVGILLASDPGTRLGNYRGGADDGISRRKSELGREVVICCAVGRNDGLTGDLDQPRVELLPLKLIYQVPHPAVVECRLLEPVWPSRLDLHDGL